jgi:hypothetical protein
MRDASLQHLRLYLPLEVNTDSYFGEIKKLLNCVVFGSHASGLEI